MVLLVVDMNIETLVGCVGILLLTHQDSSVFGIIQCLNHNPELASRFGVMSVAKMPTDIGSRIWHGRKRLQQYKRDLAIQRPHQFSWWGHFFITSTTESL